MTRRLDESTEPRCHWMNAAVPILQSKRAAESRDSGQERHTIFTGLLKRRSHLPQPCERRLNPGVVGLDRRNEYDSAGARGKRTSVGTKVDFVDVHSIPAQAVCDALGQAIVRSRHEDFAGRDRRRASRILDSLELWHVGQDLRRRAERAATSRARRLTAVRRGPQSVRAQTRSVCTARSR